MIIASDELKLFRQRHGMSTKAFCEKYKICRTSWVSWESGKKPPSGTVQTFLRCLMKEPKLMEKIINDTATTAPIV
jgi:DNA-binding transcriptional regulator YiaG